MKSLKDCSIDAVVTDPPYGLSFMGKKWDYDVPSVDIWREVLRVLKPGGHVLSFGGTRTYHRMAVNIEDAGFEIRDQVMWLYGSGFPKSHDVSKGIDKQAGAEREVIGQQNYSAPDIRGNSYDQAHVGDRERLGVAITAPATSEAKIWQGWGTALKPANEPICLARKPLEKGLTVAENVLKYGTGAINVDASRIGTEKVESGRGSRAKTDSIYQDGLAPQTERTFVQGRWPANLLLDETAAEMLDEQVSKTMKMSYATKPPTVSSKDKSIFKHGGNVGQKHADHYGKPEKINASRFFYVAKASKSERNAGLEGMPIVKQGIGDERPSGQSMQCLDGREARVSQNYHPTVKPIKLMEYLIKLITPPNGVVLDPFMGSGSTGVAAKNLGFNFTGIELNEEYFEIAKNRIDCN